MDSPGLNSPSYASLAADIHDQFDLNLLTDIVFDPASGMLSAMCMQADGSRVPVRHEIHRDDLPKLTGASGKDYVKADLRVVSGPRGNFGLVLLDCQGGTAWARGGLIDLPTPEFAKEKIATRSRLSELGKQCAAVAHELRQPIFTIAVASENMRLALAAQPDLPPPASAALDHIQDEIDRVRTIIDQTLNYAAGRSSSAPPADPGSGPGQQADFARALRHAVRLLAYEMEKCEIGLDFPPIASSLPVGMPQIELEQILLNTLRNSIESIETRKEGGWPGKGMIRVTLDPGNEQLCCTIVDNGAGLRGDEPESDFQPFVTTKGEDGNGLGLYICEQLLDKAGGRIRLLPGDGEGAKVEIAVPL